MITSVMTGFFYRPMMFYMNIFMYDDIRVYLQEKIAKLPNRGRGEVGKIAKHIGVHSTYMSLVMNGSRHLSQEQAFDLADYLQLTEMETDYFCLLVQWDRAGTQNLKKHLKQKLSKLREDSLNLSKRLKHDKKLSDQEKAVFYSSWIYSAVRLFASTNDKGVSLEALQENFDIPRKKLIEVLEFLVSSGLLILEKNLYRLGTQQTFLEKGSPFLSKHHANWRIKALQQSENISEDELMFTSPFSISEKDFLLLREELAEWLKKFSGIVRDSPAEEVACLNIDFFRVQK
ncbi:TIGR02147 family protein [Bdellovibrio bacteriovorus]|uniref:TIGR02147 family protein n=1 Tax=Bdellovibrio bacteriovorus TaxID=959 RepID=UPI0012F780FE|nr:TIGR02147 family protein [Bdellovibrio bacteriovorus]